MLDTNDFEERFYSSETLSKLSKSVGNQPGHPIEAVFFSAMVYFEKVKSGFNNKDFELKKSFCDNVKKEMEIVIDKELLGFAKRVKFSCISWINCTFYWSFRDRLGYYE